ncbi:uncharacterized protein LOC111361551 [Spodoptera litura]|uniref:Uncharacterized protein LOC111361551 n=1 Tax=Spodoptera litura TaxID=69820 RepID=A0A9J7ERI9_SPOLT|nr:uncharacterized protein LOC111361551 [Spodoptera litura]
MLQQLSDESAKAGLTMNLTKTKIMTNAQETVYHEQITVNNEEIEYVKEYIYLGQLISTEDCMKKEIERRITNTWKRFWSLKEKAFFNQGTPDESENEREEAEGIVNRYLKECIGSIEGY